MTVIILHMVHCVLNLKQKIRKKNTDKDSQVDGLRSYEKYISLHTPISAKY